MRFKAFTNTVKKCCSYSCTFSYIHDTVYYSTNKYIFKFKKIKSLYLNTQLIGNLLDKLCWTISYSVSIVLWRCYLVLIFRKVICESNETFNKMIFVLIECNEIWFFFFASNTVKCVISFSKHRKMDFMVLISSHHMPL